MGQGRQEQGISLKNSSLQHYKNDNYTFPEILIAASLNQEEVKKRQPNARGSHHCRVWAASVVL